MPPGDEHKSEGEESVGSILGGYSWRSDEISNNSRHKVLAQLSAGRGCSVASIHHMECLSPPTGETKAERFETGMATEQETISNV